ncbi:MAG: GIY-YIG nuclease family protein [Patescibacteria group bacterium]|nr:GIY-YIG nuclease family protein [Patescibacteria group bacterium]
MHYKKNKRWQAIVGGYRSGQTGQTVNLNNRIKKHNQGKCPYTKGRKPWKLIYHEIFKTRSEAMKREKFLKSGQGRKYLNSILK